MMDKPDNEQPKPIQQQIDEIMDNFDFQRVLSVMDCLDWIWEQSDRAPYRPTESDLRRCARNLLHEAAGKGGDWCVDTGGFVAGKRAGVLHLQFVVTDWDGE